jgi:glycosyltransferase involved in cell wall biosynthesis
MAEALAASDRRLREKIAVIPSGYRTLDTTAPIRPELRSMVEGCSSPRIVYVSHPSEHKNHEGLLKAMPHIMKKLPSARLLLTLEAERPPNSRYASLVRHLQSVAEDAGAANRIVWLGILSSAEVHYLLTKADVMVFPSLAESFGLPLAEAMAAGCPIVAADLPYAHDVAGAAALYFEPADPADLAQRTIEVLTDESTRKQLVAAGAAQRNRFCYADIAERLARILSGAPGADPQPKAVELESQHKAGIPSRLA